jgi:hypothetical protein
MNPRPIKRSAVMRRLDRGEAIILQFLEGRRFWFFDSPYSEVPDDLATRLVETRKIKESGDSLFGLADNSQTWRKA